MALTRKQQAFVEYYLQSWNKSDAARRAGYSVKTAYSIGHELLKKPEILAEITRRLEELKASADEVITRLTDHARGTMEDFISINGDGTASIDLVSAQTANRLHLIKKMKSRHRRLKGGGTEIENEIELYDAQSALVQLGRHHKLFTDKIEDDRVKALLDELADIRRRRAELSRARDADTAGTRPDGP